METTGFGGILWGLYGDCGEYIGDNRKENGNYYTIIGYIHICTLSICLKAGAQKEPPQRRIDVVGEGHHQNFLILGV